MIPSTITHWMCHACGRPLGVYVTKTECCKSFSTKAYTSLPCPLCTGAPLVHWKLYSDGLTRACPCSAESRLLNAFPNPHKWEALGAFVLSVLVNSILGTDVFPVPVGAR